MKNPSTTPTADQTRTQVTKRTPDVQEQIRVRAYELYEQRGEEGREVEDWLQAESEITKTAGKALSRIGSVMQNDTGVESAILAKKESLAK